MDVRVLLQAESVTSCAAARRMAVTDGSCSLRGINSRLLGFKYIMSASSPVMEKVQLGSLQSDWWLAACRVRSCAQAVCAVFSSTSTLRAAYNHQLYLRSGAGKQEHSCGCRCGIVRDAFYRFYG